MTTAAGPRPANFNATKLATAPIGPRGRACESCGAPVESGNRFCNACGAPQAGAAPDEPVVAQLAQRRFHCQTCGAETAVPDDTRSFTCPFCDSNYVVELPPAETGRQPPEFVIGFALAPEQAREKFRRWLANGNWFRPGDLVRASVEDKLKGVYLPFWSFSMLAESEWSAQIGEYWYRTETYTTVENGKTVTHTRTVTETEWRPLAGRHHEYYSGFLVSGSRGLKQEDAETIKPFQLAALKRYEPYFLAGWLSEEYSVERDAALAVCQQEFAHREQAACGAFLPGDTHSGLQASTRFSRVNSDLVLLPIYILSYRYGDRLFRFLINGQTGRAAGKKPLSARRIMALIGAILGAILLVILLAALFGALAR
jgi:DNA-directed RNA polymerase subunit RPC12/RpoP